MMQLLLRSEIEKTTATTMQQLMLLAIMLMLILTTDELTMPRLELRIENQHDDKFSSLISGSKNSDFQTSTPHIDELKMLR